MNTYYSYRNKNKVIDNSIDYYFGLLESSICYLNGVNYENVNLYVQHAKMSYFDYFNPFNIRIDVKERDFSNFLKYRFFDDKYNESYVRSIIEKNINNYDFNLVVARLIYPDYYFDMSFHLEIDSVEFHIHWFHFAHCWLDCICYSRY